MSRTSFSTIIWRRSSAIQKSTAPLERTSISLYCLTGWRPSASRASPSTSPTGISRRRGALSSSPTRRATSNIPATWRPARPMPTSPCLLVDARKGLLSQTRRHAIIASLLGIRHVVLAVNKIDLVGFDPAPFSSGSRRAFPLCGARSPSRMSGRSRSRRATATMFASRSERTPWYSGPHLLEYLETVDVEDDRASKPFRIPVQWVNRPNSDFRGFAGTIVSGSVRAGDEIAILPSGQTTRIKRIIGAGGDLDTAQARRFGHRHARRRN